MAVERQQFLGYFYRTCGRAAYFILRKKGGNNPYNIHPCTHISKKTLSTLCIQQNNDLHQKKNYLLLACRLKGKKKRNDPQAPAKLQKNNF
jgi:hypothetical protein